MDGGDRVVERLAAGVLAGVLATAAWALVSPGSAEGPRVLAGLDVLREERGSFLAGRRIGLITNHTGRSIDGIPALSLFRDEMGLNVVALFSPEHGFSGAEAAGDEVASTRDPETGIPVHSLYGSTRAPTKEMLQGIDTLVFDIQDVGVRFFTYASTMKLSMAAASASGIDFVVLDRPNPQGGIRVEGPVLDPEFSSFVGIAGLPLLHGLTVGELARFFRATSADLESLNLRVVPLRGWTRAMTWEETGLLWNTPSPNIRTVHAALAYPAFGLLEGVDFSEGRGIEETFERIGAPWVQEEALANALGKQGLRGVRFHPTTFVPRAIPAAPRPRFQDEMCRGVRIEISDSREFSPVLTGLTTISLLRSQFPESFRWEKRGETYWIDLLLGTDRPRRSLDAGVSARDIFSREGTAVLRFVEERRKHLLY
jgi:uncharacterized protein YbbC (DUF1343 family)